MVAALVPAPVASTWANMFQPGNFEKHTTYCITSHQKLIRCSLHNTQCLGNLLFTYAQLPTFLNRLAVHQVSEARTSPIPQDRNAIKSKNLFLVTSCSFFLRELLKCFSFCNVLYDRVILFIPGNKLLCVRINATFFYDNNTVVCIQPQDERYKYVTIGIIIIETAYLTVYFSLLRYTRT